MTNRKLATAVRMTLVTAGALGAGLYGVTSSAQEALEEIIVTGSRIAQSGLESASPLQIIGAEDIRATGVTNVQDILLRNPAVGTPTISRTNSNFSTSSAGVATVDLRNLGTSRTLVLVDGRRFVAGIPGESAVDLNSIPTQFIERVDILTGGASSVYGSDAVAGVVNIIYKKNFEGIEVDYQYGESAEGDDATNQASLTMGTSTADGRGNIMAHVGYSSQGAVFSRDRTRSATDIISRVYFTGDPADVFVAESPFLSSFAPQGRIFTANGPASGYTFDQNNNILEGFFTNGSGTRSPDGFNRNGQRTIAIPTERYLFATRGSFEFTENHGVFLEGTYASTQTSTDLEPYPLGSFDILPSTGGQVPAEIFYEGALRANPLIPASILATMDDEDGDGRRDYYFTRRMTEVGNRGQTADRDTFRAVAGVEGSLFGGDWRYEAYYGYGQTKESQVGGGQVNVLNFRYALEAVPDVLDLNGNGSTTDAICADANARAQGCVPISIFGFGAISPEAAAYINSPGLLATFTSQKLAGAILSGEAIDMPAGKIGWAFGAEHRREFSRSEFDPLQQAGLNAGNAIPRTEGKFDVTEGFAEVNVPLLKELPGADRLNFRGAVRVSDYSTVGSTTSWNAGFEWSPVSQLRFRAIVAESVRAPNINELYSPPSQTFPTGLVDPCIGVTATSSTPQSAACRANPGVAANIAANGAFTLTQADIQGISGFDRGNPNLDEESGESLTLGLVYQPTDIPILENFAFTVDYSKIDIKDAIVLTPRQFILDQCYTAGNPEFCSFITRRATAVGANSAGSVEFLDTGPTNSGGLTAENVDLTVTYRQAIGPGDFSASLSYTRVLDGYIVPLPGADKDPFAGEVGASKDRAYLALGYAWNDFSVSLRSTFIGSAALDDQFLSSFGFEPGSIKVGSKLYNDLQVRWTPRGQYEVFLGVSNLFDEEPPPIISGLPGNVTGTETDAGTYDAIGRRFYGGFRIKF